MTQSSGDPDVDFIRGMIPHHPSAVEMAKHGRHTEVRTLAEPIIALQEEEITMMCERLTARNLE